MSDLRKLLFLSLVLGAVNSVWAEGTSQDATAWLHKMGQAVHQLNYEGTFVYLLDNHMESMHLLHSVQGGQERERLVSLNGVPRQVVRDNHSIICILPDRRSVSAELRSGADSDEQSNDDLNRLSENYDSRLLGSVRIAGRMAQVILITPHDTLRYGHRLFLDSSTALPLKSELLDSEGKAIAQIMFTGLRVMPEIALGDNQEESVNKVAEEQYAWINQQPAFRLHDGDKRQIAWDIPGLPKGFRLHVHSRRAASKGRAAVDHYVFSDGLATLSIYIEKTDGHNGLQGESQVGTVNVFGVNKDDYQITVVGEVPAQTVRNLAQTITHKKSDTTQ